MIYKKLACLAAAVVLGATVIAVPAQARFGGGFGGGFGEMRVGGFGGVHPGGFGGMRIGGFHVACQRVVDNLESTLLHESEVAHAS